MSAKSIVMIFLTIGSVIGSYLPVLWGASVFSYSSVLLGAVGSLVGIIVGYKISQNL